MSIKNKKGQQRMTWLDFITDSMDMSLSYLVPETFNSKSRICSV